MSYVVNENCIKCKYMDCIEVCPVDCFYEGENMLVIHPDECIDCGVCEPECPVEAIVPDTVGDQEKWIEQNRQYAEIWPNITTKIWVKEDATGRCGRVGRRREQIRRAFQPQSRPGSLIGTGSVPRSLRGS